LKQRVFNYPSLQLIVFTLHCACAFHLPDTVYITTPSSIEAEAAESGIKTELVAPEASSSNQFYQQQNYPQINIFQHPQAQYAPFLYQGPLLLMEHPLRLLQQQNDQRSIERHLPSQESDSYRLYRPAPEDNPQFVDMLPPPEEQEEPNYYEGKPKKNKKYSEKVDGEKKKSFKKKQNLKEKIVKNEPQEILVEEPESSLEVSNENQARQQRETQSNEEDYDEEPVEKSAPASRLDFAMHGN
jgi:hypothetical protein